MLKLKLENSTNCTDAHPEVGTLLVNYRYSEPSAD